MNVYGIVYSQDNGYGYETDRLLDESTVYASRERAQEEVDRLNAADEQTARRQYDTSIETSERRKAEHEALVAAGLRKGEFVEWTPPEFRFYPQYRVYEIEVVE